MNNIIAWARTRGGATVDVKEHRNSYSAECNGCTGTHHKPTKNEAIDWANKHAATCTMQPATR